MQSVGELVENLFNSYRKPNGRQYTNKEVAFELQALGTIIDPSSLSKLRNGKVPNPGRDTLLGLCRFFKVPPSYFFPELEYGRPAALPEESSKQIRIALRATGLQPEVQDKIEQLIHALQSQKE